MMPNQLPDARPGNGPDLRDLDPRPRIGAQAVCNQGDYTGITFVTHNAIDQARVNAEAEHNLPGHTIRIEQVPLR